jgi:flagellar basal-body rod protein FlgF
VNFGYSVSAAGVLAAMHRQDVAANNLANIQTVGYKPDTSTTIPRQAARQEDGLNQLPSNQLLEQLGAGVLLAPNRVSFRQGTLESTGNPLDVALNGSGFLNISVAGATGNNDSIRLTRDGRLTLNDRGQLVTVANGYHVLDAADRPISLDPTVPVSIDRNGDISQGGSVVATIRLSDVPDRTQLRKVGENLFAASASALSSRRPATGDLIQSHVESSAVDPIQAMMAVQTAANAISSATRMMTIHDELMGRAINTLGRVS